MGFRFRRSIRLAPGLRLNVGKRGVSLSAGVRGASMSFGSRGTYLSSFEAFLLVPFQQSAVRTQSNSIWDGDALSVKTVIAMAIMKLVSEFVANTKYIVRCNGNVTVVIQFMYVAAQEKAVIYPMLPAAAIRHDMGGFKHRY